MPAMTEELDAPLEESDLPLQPRLLFAPEDQKGHALSPAPQPPNEILEDAETAPGAKVSISAEGYADDLYMPALCLRSLTLMRMATSKWLKLGSTR